MKLIEQLAEQSQKTAEFAEAIEAIKTEAKWKPQGNQALERLESILAAETNEKQRKERLVQAQDCLKHAQAHEAELKEKVAQKTAQADLIDQEFSDLATDINALTQQLLAKVEAFQALNSVETQSLMADLNRSGPLIQSGLLRDMLLPMVENLGGTYLSLKGENAYTIQQSRPTEVATVA